MASDLTFGQSGARGLRAIIEHVMMDTMFDLPSRTDVAKCVITEDAVKGKAKPILIEGIPSLPKNDAPDTHVEHGNAG